MTNAQQRLWDLVNSIEKKAGLVNDYSRVALKINGAWTQIPEGALEEVIWLPEGISFQEWRNQKEAFSANLDS